VEHRAQFLATAYYIFWGLLLAAFVVAGGREVWVGLAAGKLLKPGPSASTDAYFEALVGAPNASEQCTEIIERLYGKRPIFFFCAQHDFHCDFISGLISYLSWPREIHKIEVDRAQLEQKVAEVDRFSISGFIFCGLQAPPQFSHGWRVGTNLFMVPLDAPK
jgi:hypothetical protein